MTSPRTRKPTLYVESVVKAANEGIPSLLSLVLDADDAERVRPCRRCGSYFFAGRATIGAKQVEGCSPACLNVLRLRRREAKRLAQQPSV